MHTRLGCALSAVPANANNLEMVWGGSVGVSTPNSEIPGATSIVMSTGQAMLGSTKSIAYFLGTEFHQPAISSAIAARVGPSTQSFTAPVRPNTPASNSAR